MKTALITGAAGFVGRHFHEQLLGSGYFVVQVDQGLDARQFFRLDEEQFDLVLHCAAVVGGRATIEGDPLAQAANLELDAGLFQWAARTKPGRVVYFSSSAAYPLVLQQPGKLHKLREEDINLKYLQQPDQLYGWAKLTGEILAGRAREAGVSVTVVRPFSGYGEDQDPSYPFRAFTDRARWRKDPFLIWGDGTQTRDFIHIDDIVAATMLMVDHGLDGPVNLGTGRATSMWQLARAVCAAVEPHYAPKFSPVPLAPAGVCNRVADPARLLEFYTPKVSLEEGVRRALA